MQWLESPLQLRGHGFKPFLDLFFPSTNEMDEKKFPR